MKIELIKTGLNISQPNTNLNHNPDIIYWIGINFCFTAQHFNSLFGCCCCFYFFSYDTQKNGLVLLYDMSGSGYHNFDYNLARKVLSLLKVTKSCS